MTTIVERPTRHSAHRADTPTVPFHARDTRIPLPVWLHDEGGLRLAVAFTAALLVLALALAPIAAVLA